MSVGGGGGFPGKNTVGRSGRWVVGGGTVRARSRRDRDRLNRAVAAGRPVTVTHVNGSRGGGEMVAQQQQLLVFR